MDMHMDGAWDTFWKKTTKWHFHSTLNEVIWHQISSMGKKLPRWHFFTRGWNLKFFCPNDFIWCAMKVPFCDLFQNVYQAPSMCISMWIKVNNRNEKILFVLGSYEYLERLEGKIGEWLFFYVKNNSVLYKYLFLLQVIYHNMKFHSFF